MAPVEVLVHDENAEPISQQQESFFYTCHVCGDNWLSIREKNEGEVDQVTIIHQMGMKPLLKRVGHVYPFSGETITDWIYFMDEDEITEELWQEKLSARRSILKSICTN